MLVPLPPLPLSEGHPCEVLVQLHPSTLGVRYLSLGPAVIRQGASVADALALMDLTLADVASLRIIPLI